VQDFFTDDGSEDQNAGYTPIMESPAPQVGDSKSIWEANTPGYGNPYFTPMRAPDSPTPQMMP